MVAASLAAPTAVATILAGTKFARLRVRMAKTRKSTRRRKGGRLVRLRLPRGLTIRRATRRAEPGKEPRALRVVTTEDYVPRRRRRFLIPEYKANL